MLNRRFVYSLVAGLVLAFALVGVTAESTYADSSDCHAEGSDAEIECPQNNTKPIDNTPKGVNVPGIVKSVATAVVTFVEETVEKVPQAANEHLIKKYFPRPVMGLDDDDEGACGVHSEREAKGRGEPYC